MSLTKCYLHSLPQDQQDAVLGPVNPDEWVDDAENEPTEEELAEWARALMEEEEESDRFTERDESPLVKPQPKGVKEGCFDI